ncbi:MAG: hypothetical protein GY866_33550 [Proteobacteria bacterium]|nr:hypothetical protein [Pseudomonadota bacterium]
MGSVRIPKKLFKLLVDETKLTNLLGRSLSFTLEELFPENAKEELAKRLAEYPLVGSFALDYCGLLIGFDACLYYLPNLYLDGEFRLEDCLVVATFPTPITTLSETDQDIRLKTAGDRYIMSKAGMTTATGPQDRSDSGETGSATCDTEFGILSISEYGCLTLDGEKIEGTEKYPEEKRYSSLCLLSENPLRVFVGAENSDRIEYIAMDPRLRETIEKKTICLSRRKAENTILSLVKNLANHAWLTKNWSKNPRSC